MANKLSCLSRVWRGESGQDPVLSRGYGGVWCVVFRGLGVDLEYLNNVRGETHIQHQAYVPTYLRFQGQGPKKETESQEP